MEPDSAQTIDVVTQTDPPPWWPIAATLGPIVLILLIEFVLIIFLLRDTFRSKRGSEVGWERIQWALDASTSDDPRKARTGQQTIDLLLRQRLKKEDRDMLNAASLRHRPPDSTQT